MTSKVIALRGPQSAAETAQASPQTQPYHFVPHEAREALTALTARVNELNRTFAGSYATGAAMSRVKSLCRDVETEARRLARSV